MPGDLVIRSAKTQMFGIEPSSSMNYSAFGILEITMKAIIIAATAALALSASVASAAPRKQSNQPSPQTTAHEQAGARTASGSDSWTKHTAYKPHWRNRYIP
jgi:hypothetical protein